jgi:galactonate dehydratase
MVTVVDYDVFLVQPRWVFVKLETDDGTVGWGEASCTAHRKAVTTAISELVEDAVLGEDPALVEKRWEHMVYGYHYRAGPVLMSAIAGIDQALWDIKGKLFGASVADLLGGAVRDRVMAYDSFQLHMGDSIPDTETAADRVVIKGAPGMDTIETKRDTRALLEEIAAFDRALPEHAERAVDFLGSLTAINPKSVAKELNAFDLAFVEEPFLPEYREKTRTFGRTVDAPVALGERQCTKREFSQLIDHGVADIIQPDVGLAGGITACAQIIDAAAMENVPCVPSWSTGPLTLAASLQLAMQTRNVPLHPGLFPRDGAKLEHLKGFLVDATPLLPTDNYVEPLDKDGLGVEIDESGLQEVTSADLAWKSRHHYHSDGRITDN